MSHRVTYNSKLRFIESKIRGNLTFKEAKEIISKIIEIGKEKRCYSCLTDYRESEINMSTMEIYDLPKLIADVSASQGLSARDFKRAVVVKKGLENFHFYETVTLNSGQSVKIFQDIDEAKKWLSEK